MYIAASYALYVFIHMSRQSRLSKEMPGQIIWKVPSSMSDVISNPGIIYIYIYIYIYAHTVLNTKNAYD